MVSDISCYRVIEYHCMPKSLFGRLPADIYLVIFDRSDIDVPESDPIGLYRYAGIVRFRWRGSVWSVYDLDNYRRQALVSECWSLAHENEQYADTYSRIGVLLLSYPRLPVGKYTSDSQCFMRAIYETKQPV